MTLTISFKVNANSTEGTFLVFFSQVLTLFSYMLAWNIIWLTINLGFLFMTLC